MTLILALACKDGVVFASDSVATNPVLIDTLSNKSMTFKYPATKIRPLGKDKLWAASGNYSIIQQFEQCLELLLQEKGGSPSFSDSSTISLLQGEFAAISGRASRIYKRICGFAGEDIQGAGLPKAQVLIVGYGSTVRDKEPRGRILHLNYDGQPMFCEKDIGYKVIGTECLAEPILRQFKIVNYGTKTANYDMQLGCFIAFKVLEDCMDINPTIGGSIQIWTINKNERHQLNINELENLGKTYLWWPDVAEEYFKIKVIEKLNSFSVPQSPF